jgi:2,3-bisphosphoglycerate-independent phosphoglycerate mutase
MILDGIGDRSYKELDYQTPLEAAHTPVLDSLAARGANGLYHPAHLGQALTGENAHFAMFGYDSSEFPGRGALEALGLGIAIRTEDVAVMARFADTEEKDGSLVLKKSVASFSEKETEEFIRAIESYETDGVKFRFHRIEGLTGVLVMSGHVSPHITDTDPITAGHFLSELKPWQAYARDPAALNTAKALKKYLLWAYTRLKGRPVNALVTQRAGQIRLVPFFRERYGLCGISIASGNIYRGICTYVGMDFRAMPDSDYPGKDMSDRLNTARQLLDTYDFIHVHTKAPDVAAHAKDPIAKKNVIEALDAGIGEAIAPILDDPEVLIIITADHSTPSSGPLIHSGEPVPLTFCGKGVRRDLVKKFDEISVAGGALGCVRGKELIYLILNHLNRAKLCGLMDTPGNQAYWPGDYEPFRLK